MERGLQRNMVQNPKEFKQDLNLIFNPNGRVCSKAILPISSVPPARLSGYFFPIKSSKIGEYVIKNVTTAKQLSIFCGKMPSPFHANTSMLHPPSSSWRAPSAHSPSGFQSRRARSTPEPLSRAAPAWRGGKRL